MKFLRFVFLMLVLSALTTSFTDADFTPEVVFFPSGVKFDFYLAEFNRTDDRLTAVSLPADGEHKFLAIDSNGKVLETITFRGVRGMGLVAWSNAPHSQPAVTAIGKEIYGTLSRRFDHSHFYLTGVSQWNVRRNNPNILRATLSGPAYLFVSGAPELSEKLRRLSQIEGVTSCIGVADIYDFELGDITGE